MVVTIFVRYTAWHYLKAPSLLLWVWRNLLWYVGHVFSVDTLWHSLFSPWKRIIARRTKKWDFEDWASALLANFVSRMIGTFMRLILIVSGRLLQLFFIVAGLLLYLLWFIAPVIIVVTFLYGMRLLF